jgi:hypothetical protein
VGCQIRGPVAEFIDPYGAVKASLKLG